MPLNFLPFTGIPFRFGEARTQLDSRSHPLLVQGDDSVTAQKPVYVFDLTEVANNEQIFGGGQAKIQTNIALI